MRLSRHSAGAYAKMSATCDLSGNIWPQLSQLTEPLWTDPGIKSGIRVHELISTLKKKKKCRQGMNCEAFSLNPRM